MKKKYLFLIIPAVLIIFVLFIVIRWIALPNMEDGVAYQNHVYVPLGGHYGTTMNQTMRLKKAVGKFNDAIIYTLWDDPDAFYLYPKATFFHESYVLFGRQDLLPSPADGNILYIAVYIPNADDVTRETGIAAQKITLTGEAEQRILDAFRNEGRILTEEWTGTSESSAYRLCVYFENPQGLYYETLIVPYGETYGLLLADGKTLVDIGGSLA